MASPSNAPLCRLCYGTLLPAHYPLGVCAWCIANEVHGEASRILMPNPSYKFIYNGEEDNYPKPE